MGHRHPGFGQPGVIGDQQGAEIVDIGFETLGVALQRIGEVAREIVTYAKVLKK